MVTWVGVYYVQNSGLCLEFPAEAKVVKEKKRKKERYVESQDNTVIYSTLKGKERKKERDSGSEEWDLYLHFELD